MNIEIYGFYLRGDAQFMSVFLKDKVQEVREKIKTALKLVKLDNESVITEIHSEVQSCISNIKSNPFIRVCSSDMKNIRKIIPALKKQRIEIDVEVLILNNFISKEDMM